MLSIPASPTIGCCAGHSACISRRQRTRRSHTVCGDVWTSTSSATNCVGRRFVVVWSAPMSTRWRNCTSRSCTRYSTAFFHYVRQHAAADRLTHGLMTTAALPSVNAGSLNDGRHVLRQMPVPGSSSDESIATWSLGNVKRSGSI